MSDEYDTIIIGAGSAGMPAAIYTKRFGLRTLIIGKVVGGLLNDSHNVENYPGFPSIPGFELMMKFKTHVESLGVQIKEEWVTTITKDEEGFNVVTDAETYRAKTVIIATGTKHRHLGIPGEERLAGKGVSYCATCDGAFFKGKDVAIVGGGDSAAQAALLLSQHARQVYVLVRKDHMRAEPLNQERLKEKENVEILYETKALEVLGENQVEKIKLSKPYQGNDELDVQGFFVEIGADVQSELAVPLGVERNEKGEIIIDSEGRTNVDGVYAAGDVGNRRFKQAITGAAEGCIAAFSAYDYLQRKEHGRGARIGY